MKIQKILLANYIEDNIKDLEEIWQMVLEIQDEDRDIDDVLQDIEVYITKQKELLEKQLS